MELDKELIYDSVKGILEIPGVMGVCFVHREGEVVFSEVVDHWDSQVMASLAQQVVRIANRILLECNFGKPEKVVVEGDKGRIYARITNWRGFFLTVFTNEEPNVGTILVRLEEAVQYIHEKIFGKSQ